MKTVINVLPRDDYTEYECGYLDGIAHAMAELNRTYEEVNDAGGEDRLERVYNGLHSGLLDRYLKVLNEAGIVHPHHYCKSTQEESE